MGRRREIRGVLTSERHTTILWLRRDLREMVDDLLSPQRIASRGYFDAAAVRRMIEDDRQGRADNTYRIWALLTLEVWQQVFVDAPTVHA